MVITFCCRQCGQSLKADAALAGRRVRCHRCGQAVSVPRGHQPEIGPPTGRYTAAMAVTCPRCGKQLRVQPQHAGRRIRCRQCGGVMVAPSGGLVSEPAAAGTELGPLDWASLTSDESDAAAQFSPYEAGQAVELPAGPEPLRRQRGQARRRRRPRLTPLVFGTGAAVAGLALLLVLLFGPGRTLLKGLPFWGPKHRPECYLPKDWALAMSMRPAAILQSPVMQPYRERIMQKAAEEDFPIDKLEQALLAANVRTRKAAVVLSFTVPQRPPEDVPVLETYKGLDIYTDAGTYAVLPTNRLVVLTNDLGQLKKGVDRAIARQTVPLDLPANSHVAVRLRNLDRMPLPGLPPPPVTRPSGLSGRARRQQLWPLPPDSVTACTLTIKFGSGIDLSVQVQAKDAETAKQIVERLEAARGRLRQYADLLGKFGYEAGVAASMLQAVSEADLHAEGRQVRCDVSLTGDLVDSMAAQVAKLTEPAAGRSGRRRLPLGPLGRPWLTSSAAANQTVTVELTCDRLDSSVTSALVDRLGALAGRQRRSVYLTGRGRGQATATVSPVADPAAFAAKIDFGRVTAVEGRVIRVTVDPDKLTALQAAGQAERQADLASGSAGLSKTTEPAPKSGMEGQAAGQPEAWTLQVDPPASPFRFDSLPDKTTTMATLPGRQYRWPRLLFPTAFCPYAVLSWSGHKPRSGPTVHHHELWDLSAPRRQARLQTPPLGQPRALSPDGRYLAGFARGDQFVEVWSFDDGKRLRQFPILARSADSIEFVGPRRLLVATAREKLLELWNLQTGQLAMDAKLPFRFSGSIVGYAPLAVSPGGAYVALYDSDASAVRLVELKSGHPVATLPVPRMKSMAPSLLRPSADRPKLPPPLAASQHGFPPICFGLRFSLDGAELAGVFGHSGHLQQWFIYAWQLANGRRCFEHQYYVDLARAANNRSYEGPAIDWIPDKSGWLVFGNLLVDRQKPDRPNVLPADSYHSSARRMLGRRHIAAVVQGRRIGEARLAVVALP